MSTNLPTIHFSLSDRAGYRVWKRLVHHAGKKRCFVAVEPRLRHWAKRIRNRTHPAFDGESLRKPLERKRQLLAAFAEIRNSQEPENAGDIVDKFGAFVYGTTGTTFSVLFSGGCLLHAMLAKRGFEFHLIQCVSELSAIDRHFTQTLHETLRVRSTWMLSRSPTGNPVIQGGRNQTINANR